MAQQMSQSQQVAPTMTMDEVLKIVGAMAAEMKKPYIDPDKEAREKRERAKTREDERNRLQMQAHIRKHCSHKDKNEHWIISLVHNHPDGKTRGFCNRCKDLLEPEHIEIGFNQKPVLVPAHAQYNIVQRLEVENMMPAL